MRRLILYSIILLGVLLWSMLDLKAITPRTNYSLINKLSELLCDQVAKNIKIHGFENLRIAGNHSNTADYVSTKIMYRCYQDSIKVVQDSPASAIINIVDAQNQVSYDTTDNSDLLKRSVSLNVKYLIGSTAGNVKNYEFSESIVDTIRREDINFIESEGYPSKIPSRNESFYDQVVEPIVFVAGSALAVILFFTVRSK